MCLSLKYFSISNSEEKILPERHRPRLCPSSVCHSWITLIDETFIQGRDFIRCHRWMEKYCPWMILSSMDENQRDDLYSTTYLWIRYYHHIFKIRLFFVRFSVLFGISCVHSYPVLLPILSAALKNARKVGIEFLRLKIDQMEQCGKLRFFSQFTS